MLQVVGLHLEQLSLKDEIMFAYLYGFWSLVWLYMSGNCIHAS